MESGLPHDQPPAIRVENLTKRYRSGDNQLTIFENVSFQVAPGESVALVGESGAGKSTLLHLLGGLDRPTEGKVFAAGRDLGSLNESELADYRNQAVGFVWQTHYLLPEFTAVENVTMPLLIRGVERRAAVAEAEERLREVGLGQRLHHRSGELSGGEQQRVVIARALVGKPQVLLADEPTGNLDYRTGERVADLFDEIHRLHKLTSVFVTHNIGFARRCNRILQLVEGQLQPFSAEPAVSVSGYLPGEGSNEHTARKEGGTDYV
jgi:lipoprotein-releasing system ATP-binding protein